MMSQDEMLDLLDEMLRCHGPIGDEREIDALLLREFAATGVNTWQDGMSNIYAHLPGKGPKTVVMVHKDELGMIVTDIAADGVLSILPLGDPFPWKYGEGFVDVIADDGSIVSSVLSMGSTHTRAGAMGEYRRGERPPKWEDVTLFTGLDREELLERGVHIGSRAVVARERKPLLRLPNGYIGGFGIDDRICMVSLIDALRQCAQDPPDLDLYLTATTAEEDGYMGALRVCMKLQPEIVIALDISPLSPDTPTEFDSRPVIWYREAQGAFGMKQDCDTLVRLGKELGFGAQGIVFTWLGSDAGGIHKAGLADRPVAFGPAILNSHGYELATAESIGNTTRLLMAYLRQL
ncbi:MAG: hypothetical protein J4G17_06620 [Anaerolineae bacterium]|nr:hypothetical protein [Anaerolineae bacterium]